MNRRRVLGRLAGAVPIGLAGCLSDSTPTSVKVSNRRESAIPFTLASGRTGDVRPGCDETAETKRVAEDTLAAGQLESYGVVTGEGQFLFELSLDWTTYENCVDHDGTEHDIVWLVEDDVDLVVIDAGPVA